MRICVIIFSLLFFSTAQADGNKWKLVAVSTLSCQDKMQIYAKAGEKFVYLQTDREKIKLFSVDGSSFLEESSRSIIFKNIKWSFTYPSMVDPNPPRLETSEGQLSSVCKMGLK
jgi:hypothetical protein